MIDYLPPEIGLPLVAVAWIAYVIVVRHQSRKERDHG